MENVFPASTVPYGYIFHSKVDVTSQACQEIAITGIRTKLAFPTPGDLAVHMRDNMVLPPRWADSCAKICQADLRTHTCGGFLQ